jgi:hypothetical protein
VALRKDRESRAAEDLRGSTKPFPAFAHAVENAERLARGQNRQKLSTTYRTIEGVILPTLHAGAMVSPLSKKRGHPMQYFPYDAWRRHCSPCLDPLSVSGTALAGGGALALRGIGTALSAANTIAGGNYAAEAGQMKQAEANFEATQDIENAAGDTAAAQRQAIDANQKANFVRSTAVANAAAGGGNAAVGSAVTNQAQIASRGAYQAAMDLWQGQNQASGLMNQAAGKQYSGEANLMGGEEAQRAAYLNATATIAGGGASLMRMYGGQVLPS